VAAGFTGSSFFNMDALQFASDKEDEVEAKAVKEKELKYEEQQQHQPTISAPGAIPLSSSTTTTASPPSVIAKKTAPATPKGTLRVSAVTKKKDAAASAAATAAENGTSNGLSNIGSSDTPNESDVVVSEQDSVVKESVTTTDEKPAEMEAPAAFENADEAPDKVPDAQEGTPEVNDAVDEEAGWDDDGVDDIDVEDDNSIEQDTTPVPAEPEDDDREALERAWQQRQQELQIGGTAEEEQIAVQGPTPPLTEIPQQLDEEGNDQTGQTSSSFPQPMRMDHDDIPPDTTDREIAPSPPAMDGVPYETTPDSSPQHQQQAPESMAAVPQQQQQQQNYDELQHQFSEQLQRLEENHQTEQVSLQQNYEQQLNELQTQLQEMQHQQQQQSQNWNRAKEGHTLKVDALQRELDGTKELLEDKNVEQRRMQEHHLNQLRAMEKETMSKQSQVGQKGKELQELKVSRIITSTMYRTPSGWFCRCRDAL
jgi:hypothetical protein